MKSKEFIKVIKRKNISFKKVKGKITILDNQGNVDLDSLTSLPEGIQFNNQGNVDLRSLTSLPEGIQFNNQGNVYLDSLTTNKIKYKGNLLEIKIIDGFTMIVDNKKGKGDFVIYGCRYFGGKELDKLKRTYVVQRGNYYAHGESIKEAIYDVNFKYLQNNLDIKEIVANIKQKKTVTVTEYRLLTGACGEGVNNFKSENGINVDELPLEKVLVITKGYYWNEKINQYFQ